VESDIAVLHKELLKSVPVFGQVGYT